MSKSTFIPQPEELKQLECYYSKLPSTENKKNELVIDLPLELEKSEENFEETDLVVVPPDGGWGWMVVFASFMCNMVVDGIIFSFGMFIGEISKSFQVSKAEVTLVGSLMSGFYLIVGPFASAIANRYGFRTVAVGGSIVGALALAISYFATSVKFLCISYGVLGGIGFGFIYVPSVITVGYYFEKWRALATGIGVCGSGIGTFLFAPFSTYLINTFQWRNALLCHAVIVAGSAIFGFLFRPLKPTSVKEIKKVQNKEMLIANIDEFSKETKLKIEQIFSKLNKDPYSNLNNQHSIPRLFGVNNNTEYPTLADVYHTITVPEKDPASKYYQKRFSFSQVLDDIKKDEESKNPLIQKNENYIVSGKALGNQYHQKLEINRPMYKDDIFFSASLTRLPQYTSKSSLAYNLAITRLPTRNDIEEEKTCKLLPEAVKRTLSTMLDFELLKSPSFLILAFGGFFTMMGFYVPFMFLVDRAVMNNTPEEVAIWMVASIGIANTIGRVLCGIVSSLPGVNALFVTNVALTIGGIATMFSGYFPSTECQFAYCIIFGLSISCFASLRSIIVVDLLGLENLTNAFGLLLLFQGVAAIIGSPLAGRFMEYTGSHDASFYLSGGVLLTSAIMCYPLNWINKIEKAKNEQQKG